MKLPQSKRTEKLGMSINKWRSRGIAWRAICVKLEIKDDNKNVSELYAIAYLGREPINKSLREQLKLSNICLTGCRRPFRKPAGGVVKAKSKARTWWNNLPAGKKSRAIEFMFEQWEGSL